MSVRDVNDGFSELVSDGGCLVGLERPYLVADTLNKMIDVGLGGDRGVVENALDDCVRSVGERNGR